MVKKEDEIYCSECGKPIKRNAVICVHCGVQVKELSAGDEVKTVTSKDQTVAFVLAVFFGFWSWLYTYKKDQLKFWIFLGVAVTTVPLSVGWSTWGVLLVNLIGWFWALIDATRRPTIFYMNYPNE